MCFLYMDVRNSLYTCANGLYSIIMILNRMYAMYGVYLCIDIMMVSRSFMFDVHYLLLGLFFSFSTTDGNALCNFLYSQ